MFARNTNQEWERRLLLRCAADDPIAQEQFRTLSYQSCVARTIANVNNTYNRVLSAAECEALRVLLTIRIYNAHPVLPHPRRTLHRQIQRYVFAAVTRYVKGTARSVNVW